MIRYLADARRTILAAPLLIHYHLAPQVRYPMLMRPDALSFSKILPFLELPFATLDV
jgi:hypothetical protein